jgi:uncharacterized membrane protein YeiH
MWLPMNELNVLDYAGVAVFAATGALAASRKQLDIVGFLFFAVVTGVGGGTVRDLILGVPVFWTHDHAFLAVGAGVACVFFFTAHRFESRYRLLLWFDAVGLAAYAVYGAWKGLSVSGSPIVAVVMGVFTATLGGILRDMLANEPSVLMRREVYVTSALVGAAGFVLLQLIAPILVAGSVAFIAAFALRAGAIRFGWSIPAYKARSGKAANE